MRATGLVLALCVSFLPASADAALIDLGNGLIYDTTQDLTFLQDVRLARTLGQDEDGEFTWFDAQSWVTDLTYAGYDDWRLPHFFGGTPENIANSATSEISRMLVQLGWHQYEPSWGYYWPGSVGPFINLTTGYDSAAWLDAFAEVWIVTWQYDTPSSGGQYVPNLAWAVRDGGNPLQRVPEPSALFLIGLGSGLAALKRRSKWRARCLPVVLTVGLLSVPARANAELIDYGHGLIYDTVQDITWLDPFFRQPPHELTDHFWCESGPCDFNYTWLGALEWVTNLSYAGYDDWRLPRTYGRGEFHGQNEWQRSLEQLGWEFTLTAGHGPGYAFPELAETGGQDPFQSPIPYYHVWLASPFRHYTSTAAGDGYDFPDAFSFTGYIRPVRSGAPVGRVPEPSTVLLLSLGIGGTALRWRCRAKHAPDV